MFKRIKQALVESYIGAIALGYLLAEVVVHFTGIFSAPVASWAEQKTVSSWTSGISHSPARPAFGISDSLPEVLNFLLLLLFWYILLRWLYFEKPARQSSAPESASNPEPSA